MEQKRMDIIAPALDVYMKFGIKSVTMDEMSRQLGVSKKTLYLHVKDKNELVEQCLLHAHDCDLKGVEKIFGRNLNAIEEMLEVGRLLVKTLGAIHPSIFFDLSKYHPGALKLVHKHKYDSIRKTIVTNMEKGMKEGLYRNNITPDILSRLHMGNMDMIMSTEVISVDLYRLDEVYSEYFRFQIRGMASVKGLEYLKELIRKDENL